MKQFTLGAICMALICSVALNLVLLSRDGYTKEQRRMMTALVEDIHE